MKSFLPTTIAALLFICLNQATFSAENKPTNAQLKTLYNVLELKQALDSALADLYKFGEKERETAVFEALTTKMHIPKMLAKRQAAQYGKNDMKKVREQVPSLHMEDGSLSIFQAIMGKNFNANEINELNTLFTKGSKNYNPQQKALVDRFLKVNEKFATAQSEECINNRFKGLLSKVFRESDARIMKANSIR